MSELRYPPAHRLDLTENVLGHQIRDPYRWLEDSSSVERLTWLDEQSALFDACRAAFPGRSHLAAKVRSFLDVGQVGTPAWRGERSFFTWRDGRHTRTVLRTRAGSADPVALIDPLAIDPSGLTVLDAWQPDNEGRLLAYQVSSGGNEESLLRVIEVATGAVVDGPIDRCKNSDIAWLQGGNAFYYTRRLPTSAVSKADAWYDRRVYLHRVGTSTDEDVLIFGAGRDKTDYYSVSTSGNGRWLAISVSHGTAPRNDLWIANLSRSDPSSPDLCLVQEGRDAWTSVRVGRDGRLYVFTSADAPRGRLAVTDPADPGYSTWRDLIPEDPEAVLCGYAILDGPRPDRYRLARSGEESGKFDGPVLLASWARHALSEITVHDLETGVRLGQIPLPGPGSVGRLAERPDGGHEAWFRYTDYATPPVVLRFDASSCSISTWASAPGNVPVPDVTARQVTYQSEDGTDVRMLVISGEDPETQRTPRPVILLGYGGFDVSLTPTYSPDILTWVSAGGVYAIANLRGGGEEGEQWHRAGMGAKKQNVFDDFHAAAEALIRDGWTTAEQLAISGGSNGGLLVGAALVQRPSLYAAVICSAPVLDMARYERFGLGQMWNAEYGTASDAEQLGWLLSYSPYHYVVAGTAYPAVLFTVFTNDTRVDPVHAYKMCAALQYATSSGRPVLLRAEERAGHRPRAMSWSAELVADVLAFAALRTGLVIPAATQPA